MRIRSLPSRVDDVRKGALLDSLELAIRLLLDKEDNSSLSFETLYRDAYTLVLHGYGGELYDALKTCLQEHVRSKIVPSLRQAEVDAVFEILRPLRFELERICASHILAILEYLDRVYVQQSSNINVLRIKELAARVFQQEVSLHANLSEKLRPLLIAPFLRGIDGEDVDWESWNNSCKTLLEFSDCSRQLYEEQFEVPLLCEVTEHYRDKLRKLTVDRNSSDFDLLMNAFMESETMYLEHVDDKKTKQWLRSALDNVVTEANNDHK